MTRPGDPPSREQVAELRRYVKATPCEAADRLLWEGVPDRAIATSKTFKQLAPGRSRAVAARIRAR
ncbi:MAG: hypothetical protein ACRDN0_35630 [Trebonia sp.]